MFYIRKDIRYERFPFETGFFQAQKMDKTMMAIYFLILFIVAGAALLAFLCLSKPSDKKNNAGSDPSIASSSTLKNSHQIGTDAKSTAKAKIKERKAGRYRMKISRSPMWMMR